MLYDFKLGHSVAEASRNVSSVFGTHCPCERLGGSPSKNQLLAILISKENRVAGAGRRLTVNFQESRRRKSEDECVR